MDFDEYEYLEKTVEEDDIAGAEGKKKKGKDDGDKSERSYRKRDGEEDEEIVGGDGERRRSKRSRGDDSNGDRKEREKNKDRRRSNRDEDRERRRDMDRERERERERSRGEKESERDKERETERGSAEREKVRDRNREQGRSRDRDGERDKEKERERDREKERERERRDREKEKERVRELEEREKEGSRRSSSRSRRHDERERERSRGRDLEFEGRDGRRFKDKKDAGEPEADPERDQRTVFAYQMPLKANEKDVYEFFSKAGKIDHSIWSPDSRVSWQREEYIKHGIIYPYNFTNLFDTLHIMFTCHCLQTSLIHAYLADIGFCYRYIEFYDAMSVPMAIALSGQLLMGQPVMVKPSEAEKNLVQSTASTGGSAGLAGPYGPVDRKLYVGNLHFNMTELQLRQIFEPFGTVELVQLPLDPETGHCKGFGFVQFAQVEHAKAAQSLNGKLEIAGRVIKVSSVTDHVGVQDISAKSADFDDDDGGGLVLNAHSRALLMQKLDRSGIATSIVGTLGIPAVNGALVGQQSLTLPVGGQVGVPGSVLPIQVLTPTVAEPIGNPSECLVMKNMFDPATETDPDFDQDIKDDVEEECSNFGRVKHIFVDKNSAGYVYVRFDTMEAAMKAQRAMHMRWFARRLVSALFMPTHEYGAKFKS